MEALEIIIEELIYEKQRLETQKEKNLQRIIYYEERIAFYIALYQKQTSQIIKLKNQITSYQEEVNAKDGEDESINTVPPSNETLEEEMSKATREKRFTENNRKLSKQCIGHYTSEKATLEETNQEIDERLRQIDTQLNQKQKIRKRGIRQW